MKKMKIEVEIISREMIQPSSPTPHHLRHHRLSFLDQINPRVYMPMVLFYTANTDSKFRHVHKSDQLKKSLSNILTRFYVLAGRIKGNVFIDCNDEGVLYVEAQVKCQLSQVASDPVPDELDKLVPCEFVDDDNESALAIQVTFFDCGGMAIGMSISHKVGDALSYFSFLNAWSAIARGDTTNTHTISSQLKAATLFPPKDTSGYEHRNGIVEDKIVTKRFVFSASTVAALKNKYGDSARMEYPSRVEALSAFIWSRFVAATQAKPECGTLYSLHHVVNLRRILDPPLPQNYFGNLNGFAITAPNQGPQEECYGLVRQIRNEITKVDAAGYVKQLEKTDEPLNLRKNRAEKLCKGEIVSLEFSSLCRFPMYEADFGWGKPIWVGFASLGIRNLIIFTDTTSGDGIEALVTMNVEDMAKFETDKNLLASVFPTHISQISRL